MTDFFNTTTVPDCLVFKFEEIEQHTDKIDTTVYVLYDKSEHNYVVRGQRRWTPTNQSCTYSFNCDFAKDLVDFLQYIVCKDNVVNETLFNYDNLPSSSNDITYEFLDEYDHGDYEIAGYNNLTMNKKKLIRDLRMLKNISNYY